MKHKAVAYMRYSSDNQTENSIAYQRKNIETYCEVNNLDLVDEFVDRGKTGTTTNRRGFQQLLEAAEGEREWDIVLVSDFSRYARNTKDAMDYEHRFESKGIQLISVTQDFGQGNEAFLSRGITHLLNEYYSKNLAKHTHAGMRTKAAEAKWLGGVIPLGYKKAADGTLEIDPKGMKVVQTIFDMYEAGYGKQEIVDQLNAQGYVTAKNVSFKVSSLTSILHQERYTGKYIWNRTVAKDPVHHRRNNSKSKALSEQVVIDGGCPAIISQAQFDNVQNLMKHKRSTLCGTHHYMLAGLGIVRCKACGALMTGNPKTSHGRCYLTYTCPNHKKGGCKTKDIRADCLDNVVAQLLRHHLLQGPWVTEDDEACIVELEERVKQIEAKEQKLVFIIEEEGGGNLTALVQRLHDLQEEKLQVKDKITALKDLKKNPESQPEEAELLRYLLESKDLELRTCIKAIFSKILVDNEGVEFYFKEK